MCSVGKACSQVATFHFPSSGAQLHPRTNKRASILSDEERALHLAQTLCWQGALFLREIFEVHLSLLQLAELL